MGFEQRITKAPATEKFTKIMQNTLAQTKANLEKAQEQMKAQADKHRSVAPKYQIGDKVWLSTDNLKVARCRDWYVSVGISCISPTFSRIPFHSNILSNTSLTSPSPAVLVRRYSSTPVGCLSLLYWNYLFVLILSLSIPLLLSPVVLSCHVPSTDFSDLIIVPL